MYINLKICHHTKCKNYKFLPWNSSKQYYRHCKLLPEAYNKRDISHQGCPVPENCKYKIAHIVDEVSFHICSDCEFVKNKILVDRGNPG